MFYRYANREREKLIYVSDYRIYHDTVSLALDQWPEKNYLNIHLAFRDHSGSDRDEYAQNLETAFFLFGKENVFKPLEKAKKEGKKIEPIQDYFVDGERSGMRLVKIK